MKELFGAKEVGLYSTGPSQIYKIHEEIVLLKAKEETMWKQRSHANWLKDGDYNTRYFYCRANQRDKINFIHGVEDEANLWIEDED